MMLQGWLGVGMQRPLDSRRLPPCGEYAGHGWGGMLRLKAAHSAAAFCFPAQLGTGNERGLQAHCVFITTDR